MSLKREFFLDAGGFDEEFTFYYEDLDCGWRLDQRGMRLVYEPGARVFHLHDYDLERVRRRFAGVARGERLMAAKHAWFTPFFERRVRDALGRRRASPLWPLLVDFVPQGSGRLRRSAERRANDWYYQQVAVDFLSAWEGERDLDELKEYLGRDYEESSLHRHRTALESEEERAADDVTFYRTSEMYLYDLTAFAMTSTKWPYRGEIRRLLPVGSRLLDWGCGIGSDGLRLLEAGFEVAFADFDNPSTRYLKWRLIHRGLAAEVYDIDADRIPGGFDLAYSFDVIEHVEDPFSFLDELESRASLVMVNLLEPEPTDTHLHHELPIRAILDRAERRGIVRYRRHHGRSHLVVYRTTGTAVVGRARSMVERRLGTAISPRGHP